MNNSKYKALDVKNRCENKLHINFKSGKECNGWFIYNKRKVARITVPHGRKNIPQKTYLSMANQLKLSVDDFDRFLDCPLKEDEYIRILKKQISNL